MQIKDLEIFQAGKQIDSLGVEREYTTKDLENIVNSYNPGNHEAPVVIGHPVNNAPAWGWVEKLKIAGDKLLCDIKDVIPEFAELLKNKMFKKRSVSFYPNMTLRHVGFLGAMPPAIKGLADFNFNDNDGITYFMEQISLHKESLTQAGLSNINNGGSKMNFEEKYSEAIGKLEKAESKILTYSEQIKKNDEAYSELESKYNELEKQNKEYSETIVKMKNAEIEKNVISFMEKNKVDGKYKDQLIKHFVANNISDYSEGKDIYLDTIAGKNKVETKDETLAYAEKEYSENEYFAKFGLTKEDIKKYGGK